MKVMFKEFKDYLEAEGYQESEIRHLWQAVKSMDSESRSWVIRWFHRGVFPDAEIEGVTVEYLISQCGYKPLNAFIILDWLKTEPQTAKFFVLKMQSTMSPEEAIGVEIKEVMQSQGLEIREECREPDPGDLQE